MGSKFLVHLRRQWMGALALFLVLTGGVAYAANTVFSEDIVNGEVKTADIGDDQVRSIDVRNDTLPGGGLTGADIDESTLVGVCPGTMVAVGDDLCYDTANRGTLTSYVTALLRCANAGLRLPTLVEAFQGQATWMDAPVHGFWTAESWKTPLPDGGGYDTKAWYYRPPGSFDAAQWTPAGGFYVRCVTTRTN